MLLGGTVDSSNVYSQDAAAEAGLIEAATEAMRSFPDDKEVQHACAMAQSSDILFNRPNGLRSGRVGGLNMTIAAYNRWLEDPLIMTLGGAIGAWMDKCDENRAILRELGGIHSIFQNIRNNFHGKLSDWNYEPVKQSLFATSSSCWYNQDLCHEEGAVELFVALWREHGGESKIAEESMQASKALMSYSDDYRSEFMRKGGAREMVGVLQKNPNDRGAVSLACITLSMFVGGISVELSPFSTSFRRVPLRHELQSAATEAGAVDAILEMLFSGQVMQHSEHAGFNFDVDEAYNTDRDCYDTMTSLATNHTANQAAMVQAGLPRHIATKMSNTRVRNGGSYMAGCRLLSTLASGDHRDAVLSVKPPCQI
jgi:hypothetical protein